MSSRSARSVRFEMRIAPEKIATWREFAEADGRTLTDFVERAVDGEIGVLKAIANNEAAEHEAARRMHALDPAEARRLDWGRSSQVGTR